MISRNRVLTSCLLFTVAATAQKLAVPASHYAAFRAARQKNLGRPDGLLSLLNSIGLKPGTYALSSTDASAIRIAHLPDSPGQLVVGPQDVVLHQPSHADQPLPNVSASNLNESTDSGWVHLGPISLAAVPRPGGMMVLVKDRTSPSVLTYPGLRWFPVASEWRIQATWIPYTTEHPLEIALRNGQIVKEPAVGYAEFLLQGQMRRLDAVDDDGHLFFVIGDQTNGSSSYGGGRFLENAVATHGEHEPGQVILDFNDLVNPYCAYSVHQNCPRPTKPNTLPLAITAGEMNFPGEAH